MRSRFHKRITGSKSKIEPIFLIKILILILLYILFFILLKNICVRIITVKQFEKEITEFANKNKETVFEIKEITYYSSAYAKQSEDTPQIWSIDISQFTDISFSISNPKGKLIQSMEINNIEFSPFPSLRHTYFCL